MTRPSFLLAEVEQAMTRQTRGHVASLPVSVRPWPSFQCGIRPTAVRGLARESRRRALDRPAMVAASYGRPGPRETSCSLSLTAHSVRHLVLLPAPLAFVFVLTTLRSPVVDVTHARSILPLACSPSRGQNDPYQRLSSLMACSVRRVWWPRTIPTRIASLFYIAKVSQE
jgi:hypothetical protein